MTATQATVRVDMINDQPVADQKTDLVPRKPEQEDIEIDRSAVSTDKINQTVEEDRVTIIQRKDDVNLVMNQLPSPVEAGNVDTPKAEKVVVALPAKGTTLSVISSQ